MRYFQNYPVGTAHLKTFAFELAPIGSCTHSTLRILYNVRAKRSLRVCLMEADRH
jgi:hypothetical protein